MKSIGRIVALTLIGCIAFSAGYVKGRQAAPTDYRGVSQEILAQIDLAGEIDSVANRELRLSRAIVEPGGHIGLHSHRGDPSIVYVLSGVLTNHHADGPTATVGSGQVFAESGPGAHWVENAGAVPAVFLVANIHLRR